MAKVGRIRKDVFLGTTVEEAFAKPVDYFVLFNAEGTPIVKINEQCRKDAHKILISHSYKNTAIDIYMDSAGNKFKLLAADRNRFSFYQAFDWSGYNGGNTDGLREALKLSYDSKITDKSFNWFETMNQDSYRYAQSYEQYCAYLAVKRVLKDISEEITSIEEAVAAFEQKYIQYIEAKVKFEKISFDDLPILVLTGSRTKPAVRS